jgi:DNA-directed RNA polymerase specialized sigma24 family protein
MESDNRWQALLSHPKFKPIQRGQVRRIRAVCHDPKEAESAFLSAIANALDAISELAGREEWGGVYVVAHRRVSSWLRKEVPLVRVDDRGGGDGDDSGSSEGEGGRRALGSRPSMRRRFVPLPDDDWPQLMDPSVDAAGRFALLQAAQMVRACLEQFAQHRPRDAELLREAFLEGRSRAELARTRGIKPGAARQRLLTAGRRFHAFLEDDGMDEVLQQLL